MSEEVVPEWLEDATTEVESICAVIAHWKPVEQMMAMPAAPKPLLMHHAQQLYDMGLRFHADEAVLFKVKNEKTGGPDFVSAAEKSEADMISDEQAQDEARDLLSKLNPGLLDDLESLSPEERENRKDSMQETVVKAMAELVQLREQFGITVKE